MSDFRKRMLEEDHERALLAKASIDELRRKMVYRTEDVTRSDIYTAILELDERLRKVEDAIRQLPGRERALSQFDEVKA